MFKILNRFAWILSFFISGYFVNLFMYKFIGYYDFYFWSIVTTLIFTFITKKIFFSSNFIKNNLLKFNDILFKNVIEKLKSAWMKIPKDIKIKSDYNTDIALNNENIWSNELKSTILNDEKIEIENLEQEEFEKMPINNIESNQIEEDEAEYESPETPSEPSKIWLFLNEFFAENVMAKIGWILLALWVIFLMGLVYNLVWPVEKIIIWFALWFTIYLIWIKLKSKWYETESMILLWTAILINYIVILSGKFIIWDWIWILSSYITFLLLILNTVFSVVTAFVYKSKNLLLFSIIFAYIIPFLTWWNYESYIIVWYSLILSLWWFAISNYFYKEDDKLSSLQILFISLIWWNVLLLSANLYDSVDFTIKMIWYNIINFISIYLLYKNKFEKNILSNFIISYIFLALLMFSWSNFTWLPILISFVIAVLGLLVFNSFLLITAVGFWLIYMIFLPILFVLWFLFIGWAWSWIILLPLFLISYLALFSFWVGNILSTWLKYIFFILVWAFLVIWNHFIWFDIGIDNYSFTSIFITAFIFLFSTYFLSSKKDLHYLYTVWTLVSIFILLPILTINWEFYQLSIVAISLFWLSNYLLPFINSNLVKNDSQNLVLWSVIWIIFIWLNLYRYWVVYFPWVTLWLWFLVLAVFYFVWGFILFNRIEIKKTEKSESDLNFIYAFLGIAISLFSTSVAIVFSEVPLVIALVWLFESSIVFYFANKLKSNKVYIAWIILFIIWIIKYISATLFWQDLDIWSLVWISFITISLFLNIIFSNKSLFKSQVFVKILHLIWIIIVYINLNTIFDFNDIWKMFIFTSVFLFILWVLYNKMKDNFLISANIFALTFLMFSHIFVIDRVSEYSINYLFTLLIWIVLSIQYELFHTKMNKVLLFIFWGYFFIASSIYLYDATDNSFSLTIYWWILSLFSVHIWIFKDNKYIRWTWLFLLIITLLKIVGYDIWNNLDNWIIRVIALMFVWWIMIYISSLYKKNNLKIWDDLNLSFESENTEIEIPKTDINPLKKEQQKTGDFKVNKDLDKFDIQDKKIISFIFDDWKIIKIRAKNLIKMWMIVIKQSWKNHFEKWELRDTYKFVKNNYKSELSKKDYDRIIEIIENFIEIWWKIEIV